jgi:negative regulator of flagellin synthesis FlgM
MIQPVQASSIDMATAAGSAAGSGAVPAAAAPAAATAGAAEEVTVSADAATTTQLLEAARGADGVNQGAVQQLRGAIQAGTYQVPPHALAKAIAGALRESQT